jgi:hypothetical protein
MRRSAISPKLKKRMLGMAEKLRPHLDIRPEVLFRVLRGNDWELVLKCHALIEAGTTRALAVATNEALADSFSNVSLGDTKSGKVKMLTDLGAINSEHRFFIQQLSHLRNRLVHDVREVEFSFVEYHESLSSDARKNFVRFVLHMVRDEPDRQKSFAADLPNEADAYLMLSTMFFMVELGVFCMERTRTLAELNRKAQQYDEMTALIETELLPVVERARQQGRLKR